MIALSFSFLHFRKALYPYGLFQGVVFAAQAAIGLDIFVCVLLSGNIVRSLLNACVTRLIRPAQHLLAERPT